MGHTVTKLEVFFTNEVTCGYSNNGQFNRTFHLAARKASRYETISTCHQKIPPTFFFFEKSVIQYAGIKTESQSIEEVNALIHACGL